MVMVHIVIKTDKFILEILKTIDLMVKENIFGLILIIIKDNSWIIRDMEKEHFIWEYKIFYTEGSSVMIKNVDMANKHINKKSNTLVILKMI